MNLDKDALDRHITGNYGEDQFRIWHIEDWMGNVLFNGKLFDSFDEAWEFIYANVPDEGNAYDDFYVEHDD